jgi:hypothetical protein
VCRLFRTLIEAAVRLLWSAPQQSRKFSLSRSCCLARFRSVARVHSAKFLSIYVAPYISNMTDGRWSAGVTMGEAIDTITRTPNSA